MQVTIDRPLHIAVVISFAAQLDIGGDGNAFPLLHGGVATVQRQIHSGIVEHRRHREILRHHIVPGLAGLAVAPLVESISGGRNRRNGHGFLVIHFKLNGRNAGLSVSGEGTFALLHSIADFVFEGRGSRLRSDSPRRTGGTLGNIVCVGTLVICLPSMALYIAQQRVDAGRREGPCAPVKIGFLRKAGAVFQHLGAVQELPAHLFTEFCEFLVVLVNIRLFFSRVFAALQNRRDGIDNHIAVSIGR